MTNLNGKVVAVTGAFGALGGAVAAAAKAAGARVAVIDHAEHRAGLDFDHVQSRVDLSSEAAVKTCFQEIAAHLGPIHGLVNVAGGFVFERLEEGGPQVFERMFRLNLLTAACASWAVLPHLAREGAAIVNVAAAAAGRGGAGMGAYAASKSGVLRLTESLAEELKGRARVNAVSPTIIDTEQNRRDMPKADPSRWVRPSELAETILFLLSDAASGVTGAEVRVAGRT